MKPPTRTDLAPIPLRLVLGVGFLVHGIPKFGSKYGIMTSTLEGMGWPLPEISTWYTLVWEYRSRGMSPLHWIVVALAVIEAGWLAIDGGRAFVVGEYIIPKSGPYADQLGPWSTVVSAVGIEPRSVLMKSIHVGLGSAWLLIAAGYVLGLPWAWCGMLAGAVLSLWYLPFGTLLSLIQIVLLMLPQVRGPHP